MKRRIPFWLTSLILAVMLAGCGNPVKTEDELMKDLNSTSQIYMVEGSQVTELSIIKRLTDENNHTDKVYVSILIDHPNATETRAYIMNYTLYNDGWMLDAVEDYFGDETVREVKPKGAPSNEQVMAELIAYSNAQIDAAYAEQYISEELTHTYFFEEGKYATKIYTGSFTSETEYSCIVETNRVFNYVEVEETQMLHFWFDHSSYEWKIYADKIIRLYSDCYLDGQWYVPSNGATIQFTWIGGHYGDSQKERYDEFNGICVKDGETVDFYVTVPIPSSQMIDAGWTLFGEVVWGPVHLELQIAPDMIHCFDFFGEIETMLEPDVLDHTPSTLDVTGVIDCGISEKALPYYEFSKEIVKITLLAPNVEQLEGFWHSSVNQDNLTWFTDNIIGTYSASSVVHETTEVITSDSPEAQETFDYLQQQGCHASEIALSTYCFEIEENGNIYYYDFGVMFAQEDGNIYVINLLG